METTTIYEQAEKRHSFAISVLFRLSVAMILGSSGLSAVYPISFAIFGYPPPNEWALPMKNQLVVIILK